MGKRVLVTAAMGNVGREVAQACVAANLTVRVADLRADRLAQRFPALELAQLDFTVPSTWPAALSGVDQVFLLRPPPLADMSTTLNPFIDAAYAAGVQHVVFLSVLGAERHEWVPHRKVERHLEQVSDLWTVLRPGFFAQNLQDAYRADIVEDGRLYVPAGEGQVAFLDVRDAAEVTAKVFQSPETFRRQALVLTGPSALTFAEVARVMTAALGRPIRYRPASLVGYLWHLVVHRRLAWMQAAIQTYLHHGLRRGDAQVVDPTLARLLGRPARNLPQYVADHVEVWRSAAPSQVPVAIRSA